ncbi:D-alanyl-D-alanine carboxypeptidase family protein [Oceanobacillus bengalensis]|uniref:D-alanyl-D-alanine carboxypeptidase n=1 Tax=Oceanobacillus bengalensis TaxID=1435466 RepID=A0A494Z7X3_9BACI|nr:D-alanyl-D-alanine carboxypeptidase family protein [Oceanobacillus bengalensis]RKQ18694.1 D-alanyl-D-alanine carboxypeptidase [Oceanobacillus bengalensis]
MKNMICFFSILFLGTGIFVDEAAAEEASQPEIVSEAAILIEADTGQVLYEKNAGEAMHPASLTKIATAIFAIEKGKLDENVTVSENATNADGTTVFLEEGEQVALKKLIQGMLINSGNDAGVAIAEHVSGSMAGFAMDLNTYLKDKIGTKNTNFKNPHGLYEEDHMTTAEDLAKITKYAMQNKNFMNMFSAKELDWDGKSWDTTIQTHHRILKGEFPYDGVTGGKNGFVNQSGFTLVTTAERDELSLIAVTLKANTDDAAYEDTIKLLDYGFDNYRTSQMEDGASFTVDGQKYIPSEKIQYTHAINDTISKNVNEDGILTIEDKRTSSTFELEKVEPQKETQVESFSTTDVDEAPGLHIDSWIIVVVLILTLVFFVFIIFKYLRTVKS